ncbi:MAG: hypothetical protein KF866_12860 [Phycisphaeraceae bacterium]|nr:hypothetical protein [Phycisphaeraceae bacterium]
MKILWSGVTVSVAIVGVASAGPEIRRDVHGNVALGGLVDDGSSHGATPGESLTEWTPIGPFGGDVQDVNASPTDPMMVLAAIAPGGSVGGTLYRSTDGGSTWATVPALAGRSVYDIEFDPFGVAYIGTFDGVWKSVDNGASFSPLDLGIGVNDQVFDVAIDPNDPNVIYCGVADANGSQTQVLLRSVNAGATWSNLTPPGAVGQSCRGIAINPNNSLEIMAVFGGAFGGGSAWFTSNGGATWNNASSGLPNNPMNDVIWQNGDWIIGGGQLFGGQVVGVYRSNNNGTSWTAMHDGSWPSLVVTDVQAIPGTVGGLLVSTTAGIHRSMSGTPGTWDISAGGTSPYACLAVRHAPDDANRIYIGANSFGVVRSTDNLASSSISSVGIGALDVHSIHANPVNPDELAIAFQGQNNGGIYVSLNGGQTWTIETGLPGSRYNTVRFDANGTLFAINDGPTGGGILEGLYRRNAPGNWTPLGPDQGPFFESRLYGIDFGKFDPLIIVLSGQDFGVAGFEATVWRSLDAGGEWVKVYESVESNETVQSVFIVDDGSDLNMIASFTDFGTNQTGGALRSTDGGTTWVPADNGLATNVQGYSLAVSPDDASTFFMADGATSSGGGGLWVTTDAGASWTRQIHTPGFRAVAVNPSDADHIIIGTTFAAPRVRESTDGGLSFFDFMQGLAATITVRGLSSGPEQIVYLATNVGTYKRDLPGGGCPADLSGSSDPNDPGYGVPDGQVDASDFFYFLDQFVAGNLAVADLSGSSDPNDPAYGVPDGQIDASDFFYFLDIFVAGCP